MRIKTFTLISFLIILNIDALCQLNPVRNLVYEQTYSYEGSCPNSNCFKLEWSVPDPSQDVLKGYNIYKNNTFYKFTEANMINCFAEAPCSLNDFYDGLPFWVKIKAVYNDDMAESLVNDSVEVWRTTLGIETSKTNKGICLTKNPVKKGENISVKITEIDFDKGSVSIYSVIGSHIKDLTFINDNRNTIRISTNDLNAGVYILVVKLGNISKTLKVMITE